MDSILQAINAVFEQEGTTALVLQVFTVVFLTLLLDFFQKFILRRIHARITKTVQIWDDAFHFAINPPLTLIIWLVGITFAAAIVAKSSHSIIFDALESIRYVGVIIAFTWFLLRLIQSASDNLVRQAIEEGKSLDMHTVEAVTRLIRLSVIITSILMALQTLGFSVSGILAFGGMGGIAVGFAAKDLLANFFGGLMIYLDRPFKIGDWIRSPDRDIEGTVEKIGWRLSVIRTFDKRPLYIPNATFANIAVENPSRMSHRRIYENIGIRYDDASKVGTIIQDIKAMLKEHPDIDSTQTLIVNLNKFASSSLEFFVYTFTKTTNWIEYHNVKQDVLLKIIDIVEGHNAEFAFPTSTVHLQSHQPSIPSEGQV